MPKPTRVWVRFYTARDHAGGTELRTNEYEGCVLARSASFADLGWYASQICRRHNIKGYTDQHGKFVQVLEDK